LVFGSVLRERYFFVRSDVYVYIVIKNNDKRYRGIKVVDGVEIDYFVNPIEQLQKEFEIAKKSQKKTVLFMLANGKIFQDKENQLQELQTEARKIIKNGPDKMSKYQIHMAKYFISDYMNDIKDTNDEKGDFSWQRNIDLLSDYLVETICKFHRIYITKPKYQKKELEKIDARFVELYEKIANTSSKKEKQKSIEELAQYVVRELGKDLDKEWEIITSVD
jgi:hypothetical protein